MSEFDDSGYYRQDESHVPAAEACCGDFQVSVCKDAMEEAEESLSEEMDLYVAAVHRQRRQDMAARFLGVMLHRGLEGPGVVDRCFTMADAILSHE